MLRTRMLRTKSAFGLDSVHTLEFSLVLFMLEPMSYRYYIMIMPFIGQEEYSPMLPRHCPSWNGHMSARIFIL